MVHTCGLDAKALSKLQRLLLPKFLLRPVKRRLVHYLDP